MDDVFYIDVKDGVNISYHQLIEDVRNTSVYNPYCKEESYYEVFKNIVTSLVIGEEIILLDADFTDVEVRKLVGDVDIKAATRPVVIGNEIHEGNFEEVILSNREKWRMTLFTSGTTGLPKSVSHSFASITRQVKKSERHINDIWGFAFNPTHMAGLQVFFQALLNRNSIIRLFGLDTREIIHEIKRYNITNISATPTFYRLLLPPKDTCESVTRLTSGGEKFDEHTLHQLIGLFPNAKLTNVYASTEAGTLFASAGNEFVIKEEMKNLVRVENGELLIHSSLLGKSSLVDVDGDWYHTGDIIEIVHDIPLTFQFLSRKNEMINVGGYKVNPHELEECIRECQGVIDVYVYAKDSKILGKIVCCDVVRENENITEKMIREQLRQKLQEFKIPRIFKFVEQLNVTRTGKISRKL